MAGILDSKKRIMDTIVLPTGRTQAFGGHMQFRYVTLTDRHAIYESTGSDSLGNKIAEDASKNVYFEATARPHDMLCPETDLNSKIVFDTETIFQNSDVVAMAAGDMLTIQGAFPTDAALADQSKVSTGQDYLDYFLASNITQALTSSYVHQHFLASVDPLHPFKDFNVNKNVLNIPCMHRSQNKKAETTKLFPPLYLDKKFFRHTNFQFLPPVNKLPPYAKMQRVLPWIISNLDLKQFSYSDYKDYFGVIESEINPAELEALKSFEVLKDNKIKFAGDSNLKGAQLSAYESYYAISEAAWGQTQALEGAELAFVNAFANAGLSDVEQETVIRASLPIIMSGKQLSEVDFAIARASYMGSYDVAGPVPEPHQFTIGKFFDYHVNSHLEAGAWAPTLPASSFRFTESSRYNNTIIQMFEFNSTTSDASPMSKLVAVPGGTLSTHKNDETADLYYLGKLFWDPDDQQPRFVSIFHLLLASSDVAADHGYGSYPGLLT